MEKRTLSWMLGTTFTNDMTTERFTSRFEVTSSLSFPKLDLKSGFKWFVIDIFNQIELFVCPKI